MAYVVRGRKDVENFPVEDCHDGQGTIFVRQLLGYEPLLPVPGNPEDFDSLINFMHETTLPVGTTIGLHPHVGNEEIYYVVEGKGEMTVDGNAFVMEPGTACLTKSGSKHTFKNIGDSDLRIIVIEAVFDKKDKKSKQH
ncbi:cupin domain-containing protein [Paenibacillus abyssi]|uniref:Cupin type-2 domain-containing protein n=1 Tax=Paenibacillus abyssi TaxID=1340531 RepID=A0A917FU47_9BACL|nr:cupin domain-containing protein [Paenibacillus abyssi]GGG01714.1 hypothetical protein GCM10010916_18600 [Paenibacillus abyssi]